MVPKTSTAWRAIRKSSKEEFHKDLDFNLPGLVPCLSADGLRQYVFDGKVLKCARRLSVLDHFSAPEIITTLDLPNYQHDPRRRRFWISDDEEWLYYSANVGAGDLYAVRTFQRPRLGLRSARRENRPEDHGGGDPARRSRFAAVHSAGSQEKSRWRQGPPYPKFREEFVKLLKDRQYAAAAKAIEEALKDPRFEQDQELLKWDRQELESRDGILEVGPRTIEPNAAGNETPHRPGDGEFRQVRRRCDPLSASPKTAPNRSAKCGPPM